METRDIGGGNTIIKAMFKNKSVLFNSLIEIRDFYFLRHFKLVELLMREERTKLYCFSGNSCFLVVTRFALMSCRWIGY